MIVRQAPDGALILIAQTDHSRLVGAFAAHWGNDDFAPPRPYESMARAAAFHDFGWLRYETAPLYDAGAQETPGFTRVPTSDAQLEAYQWCIDGLLAADAYAALIVSMHRTGLWRGRYDTIEHPSHPVPPSLPPSVTAFIGRNEARQAREREKVDAAEIRTNYHLLQVWDLLGLYFTCQDPYRQYVEPVPTGYGAGETTRLELAPVAAHQVAFAPYPFATRPLKVQFVERRLEAGRFADEAAFRRAWFEAPLDLVEFELV
ncbi:MAG: DUF3891 family protein [Stellaceae bacterium]